jgi:hypothetical protein
MNVARDAFDSYRALDWREEVVRSLLVVVLGCGALGSHLSECLAAMGVGCIVLVDDDVVQPHNRLRMATVTAKDVGRGKVEALTEGLGHRFGDIVKVIPLVGSAQTTLGSGMVRRAACVFLCADNRAGRHFGCRVARAVGTPHVSGAIDGFMGMVSGVFDPPHSACYECTLSRQERDALMPVRFSCAPHADQRAPSAPTTPMAAAMTAAWMTEMMLRYVHGEREGLLGQRIFINPLRNSVRVAQFQRRAHCACAGVTPIEKPTVLDVSRVQMTPRGLLREAGTGGGWVVLNYVLVTEEMCRRCGFTRTLDPPRHEAMPSICPDCASAMTAVAMVNMLSEQSPFSDYTFARLGLPLLDAVMVNNGNGARTFELGRDARWLGLVEEAH